MKATVLLFAISLSACGPGIDRTATLERLRGAIEEEIDGPQTLGEHNEIVVTVSRNDVLNGLRQSEVEAAIGRGQECGSRPVCTEHGFEASDWLYEVGRQDGLPAGPTLVIGFDRQGFVTGTYYLTRSAPAGAQ